MTRTDSRTEAQRPKESVVLDRRQLLAAIEQRTRSDVDPAPLLLLIGIDTEHGSPASADVTAQVAERVGTMIRSTDLIAALDPGELAMVVFDLVPIQRGAFTDGIRAGVQAVLDSIELVRTDRVVHLDEPAPALRARVGSASLTANVSITAAFREADRAQLESVGDTVTAH